MVAKPGHPQALAEMVLADVLLAAMAEGVNAETVILGKVFEYLASARPILMVGPPESAIRRLISRCQAGVTVDLDSGSIREPLIRLWKQWSKGALPPGCPPDRLQCYTRR